MKKFTGALLVVTSLISTSVLAAHQPTGCNSLASCLKEQQAHPQLAAMEGRVQLASNYSWGGGGSSYRHSHRDYSYSEEGNGDGFFELAYAPENGPAHKLGTVVVDPNKLMWAAYDSSGKLVKSGKASAGRSYCPDIHRGCKSPIGQFHVYAKEGPNCKSRKFPIGEGGAPMPYCMFFHGGYALHGSYEVPHHNASHGCLRIVPSAAEWLSRNFVRNGTTIIVKPY